MVRCLGQGSKFDPDKRPTVACLDNMICLVLHVSLNTRCMTTSDIKFQRFAAVETNHNFVTKQGLTFELKILRSWREIFD